MNVELKDQKVLKKIKGLREKRIDLNEVVDFINKQSPETVIYVGGDSSIYKVNDETWILFIVIIGIHIDGCKGVKVFKQAEWIRDYSHSLRQRLLAEAGSIATIASQIAEYVGDRHFQVHLDINSKKEHASNVVIKEAVGYVKGMLAEWMYDEDENGNQVERIKVKVKPDAFMGSIGADRYTHV